MLKFEEEIFVYSKAKRRHGERRRKFFGKFSIPFA